MSLFTDPINWIRSMVGSKVRTSSWIIFYLVLGLILCKRFLQNNLFGTENGIIFGFILFFPIALIYASYKLLYEYDKHVSPPENWRKVSDMTSFALMTSLAILLLLLEWRA